MTKKPGLGRFEKHSVSRSTPAGCYLETEEGTVFLDTTEMDIKPDPDTEVEVCVYHDQQGHLTASTKRPYVTVGSAEVLRVKTVGDIGAFADWGMEKDLFVPFAEQINPLIAGQHYLIQAYVDGVTGRLVGSTKIDKYYPEIIDVSTVKNGEEVIIKVFRKTDLGFKVLVNDMFTAMIYDNELIQTVEPGMTLTAYIKTIRDDGKIDCTLRKPGYNEILDATNIILKKLSDNDGFLPFNDKSDPEIVRKEFNMSKRTFKAAIGGLLKTGKIDFVDDGIRAKES